MPSERSSTRPRGSRSSRYLPAIRMLEAAARELPKADIWPEDDYEVALDTGDGKTQKLVFQKVKFKTSSGKSQHWIYDGKILVR